MRLFKKKSKERKQILLEEVPFTDKERRIRILFVIIFAVIGIVALTYAISGLIRHESGWQTIQADQVNTGALDQEILFQYYIGNSGIGVSGEIKQVRQVYSELLRQSHRLFNASETFPGVHNLAYLNEHVNEVVKVNQVLYDAFEKLEKHQSRAIYLAPIYELFEYAFFAEFDTEAAMYDPATSADVRAFCGEVASFASDPDAIQVETLGNLNVRLSVSSPYLEFARDNGVEKFIDLFWMKNAFIVDYVADQLIEEGITKGNLSSYDGFIRNLDQSETSYSFNVFDRVEQDIFQAARFDYKGQIALVYLRNYKHYDLDRMHYYTRPDGTVLTSYVSPEDGLPRSALNDFTAYSRNWGCSDILLHVAPLYIADTLDDQKLQNLFLLDIDYIFCDELLRICYSEANAAFSELFQEENIAYTPFFMR